MQTVSIHDELAQLRADTKAEIKRLHAVIRDRDRELEALRADLAMRPGSIDLLHRIRTAAGLNQYTDLSTLDDHVRRIRASLLEMTDVGRSIWGPYETERARARARTIANGTGDVPQAAE